MLSDTNASYTSRLLSIPAVAARLGLSTRTIYDPRWRKRAGLKLTRVGRHVGVLEDDLTAVLKAGRER